MSADIHWYYYRKSWTGCRHADSALEERELAVRETVDARKQRYGAEDLAEVFAGAEEVLVAKGKTKVLRFSPEELGSEDFAKAALGRSGNLRAPTIRVGKRFLVGYSQQAYEEFLA